MKSSFSGHEKFECKTSWLPLAFKDIEATYGDLETAISILGIGSNKVKSLRQWIYKFALFDGDEFTEECKILFANDPYLEKPDSLWILHTCLVQNFEKATLYSLFFNKFYLTSFTKESLLEKTKSWCEDKNMKIAPVTLENDVNVFIRMYLSNKKKEEFSTGILSDLNILNKIDNDYMLNMKNPAALSDKAFLYIFLYCTKEHEGNTVSVKDLQYGEKSLQFMLCLTEDKFLERLEKLSDMTNNQIRYQEAAGIKQIYINDRPDLPHTLLNVYQ